MSNMSYCRFENTARDLRDCLDAIENREIYDISSYEVDALTELLDLCKSVLAHKDEIERAVDSYEEEEENSFDEDTYLEST